MFYSVASVGWFKHQGFKKRIQRLDIHFVNKSLPLSIVLKSPLILKIVYLIDLILLYINRYFYLDCYS